MTVDQYSAGNVLTFSISLEANWNLCLGGSNGKSDSSILEYFILLQALYFCELSDPWYWR